MALKDLISLDILNRNAGYSFVETSIDSTFLVELKNPALEVVVSSQKLDLDDCYLNIREEVVGDNSILYSVTTAQLSGLTGIEEGTQVGNFETGESLVLNGIDWVGSGVVPSSLTTSAYNPVNIKEIYTSADLDALAGAGSVITIDTPTTLVIKGQQIITINRFVVNEGGQLNIVSEGNGVFQLVYAVPSTFITLNSGGFRSAWMTYASVAGGTLLAGTAASSQTSVSITNCLLSGWNLGAIEYLTLIWRNNVVFDWLSGLSITDSVVVATEGNIYARFTVPVNGDSAINVKSKYNGTYKFSSALGDFTSPDSYMDLNCGIGSDQIIINNSGTRGKFFSGFVGASGSYTAVTDASIPLTSITSVTDSSGAARFNFTGATIHVNQELQLNGYVTNTGYNQAILVTATDGISWFEGRKTFDASVLLFAADEAGGSFISDSITLTEIGTTLLEGDSICETTDIGLAYNGGFTVYNAQTDSFQINRKFAGDASGTWSMSSLDNTDPRVIASANTAISDSSTSIEATFDDVPTTTLIPAANAIVILSVANWVYDEAERMVLGERGDVIYTGLRGIRAKIDGNISLEPASSGKLLSARFMLVKADRNPVTYDSTTNTVVEAGTPRVNGQVVTLDSDPAAIPAALRIDIIYYVVNATANSFQLSYTGGGAAITFADNGVGTSTYALCETHGSVPSNTVSSNNPRGIVPHALANMMTGDRIFICVTNEDDATNILISKAYYRAVE